MDAVDAVVNMQNIESIKMWKSKFDFINIFEIKRK